MQGHNGPVNSLLLQGKRIFSGSADRRIRLWAETGETFAKMEDVLKGFVVVVWSLKIFVQFLGRLF